MRKHHKRWVALVGAAAIASTGWVGLSGTVSADERDAQTLTWSERGQKVSYSLDGYEIGYLPAGLDGHGYQASSRTDRMGNRQSQLSWMHGPDQLLGRVSVVRSDRVQHLDDLRTSRYGHLPERTLERLDSGEALRTEAYLSPETGDLFWVEEPGVAVGVYLQPDRWGSGELVRMAESLAEKETGKPVEGPTVRDPAETTDGQDPEAAVAETVSADGGPTTPAGPEPSEDPAGPEGAQEAEQPAQAGTTAPPERSEEEALQAKECFVHRFVDPETGESDLDETELSPSEVEVVERVLDVVGLGNGELDGLVAALWHHADEDATRRAVDECARELGLGRIEFEGILGGVDSLVTGFVRQENEEAEATHRANVSRALEQGDSARTAEPIGAREWAQMVDSLPWSLTESGS